MRRLGATTLWDWPTRAVHWLLTILVAFSWWSATHDHLPWHRLSGYGILGLVLFRLGWGFFGSETARFTQFVRRPAVLIAYVRGRAPPAAGHNPLGGWSILAMLLVLGLQVGLGLFSVDEDGLEAGPLSRFVSFDTGRAVARLHHLNFWLLLALIAAHLAAIAVHTLRGNNLVGPMLTGRAVLPQGVAAPRIATASRMLIIALIAAALSGIIASGLRWP